MIFQKTRRAFLAMCVLFVGQVAVAEDTVEVIMSTSAGDVRIELYAERAPVTVENFLKYVDGMHYEGGSFYRTVTYENDNGNPKIEVIQGGLGNGIDAPFPPIAHEDTEASGIPHTDGVVSMARNGVGTASSEFFICLGDQPGLDKGEVRNPDGPPDPHIEWINFKMQVISTFFLGAGVSMYFSFYVYKAFDLHYLKWFATHGAFYFIFLPLIFTFVIPYSITGQLEFYSKLVVIIPWLYGASWVYLIYKAFDKEFDNIEDDKLLRFKKKEMVAVYIALAFWMTMPFSTFINVENQIWQQGMASVGFLVMSIAYVAVQVNQSRYEYQSTMTKMDELTKAQKKLAENALKIERIDEFLDKFRGLMSDVHFKDREVFSPVLAFVNNDWDIKGEMKYFENHFEAVYSDFFSQLTKLFPTLNQKEKKYLTYMKIGLSSKEASALMGASLDSLKSYRYRMKKKLSLDKEIHLEDFIASL